MKQLLILLLLIGFCCSAQAQQLSTPQLQPFTSDGCSAFPDGTLAEQELWLKCCYAHDLAYWQGGTWQQRIDADNALQACVTEQGVPAVGLIMLVGVRVGGTPFLPTTFRWGYGWPYPRTYGELSEKEHRQVEQMSQGVLIKD